MKKSAKVVLASTIVAGSLFTVGGTTFSFTPNENQVIPTHEVTPEQPFTDVNSEYWAYTEINWGIGQGLVFGYDDGSFRPSELATQAQFMAILTRFAGEELNESLSEDHWADVHYDYLSERNFPIVESATHGERNQPIRRGDIARVLSAYMGKDLHETEAIAYLYEKDLSTGRDGNQTIEGFGADDYLNRAQLVTFMYRMAELGYTDLVGLEAPPSGSDNDDVEDIEDQEGTFERIDQRDRLDYVPSYEKLDTVRDLEEALQSLQVLAQEKSYEAMYSPLLGGSLVIEGDDFRISANYTPEIVDGKTLYGTKVRLTIGGNKADGVAEAAGDMVHALVPEIPQQEFKHMFQESIDTIDYWNGVSGFGYYNSVTNYHISIGGTSAPSQAVVTIEKVEKKEGDQ